MITFFNLVQSSNFEFLMETFCKNPLLNLIIAPPDLSRASLLESGSSSLAVVDRLKSPSEDVVQSLPRPLSLSLPRLECTKWTEQDQERP